MTNITPADSPSGMKITGVAALVLRLPEVTDRCDGPQDTCLIKIDTDGHELDVLKGAVRTLKGTRPLIVFELTTYLLASRGIAFSEYVEFLTPFDYQLVECQTGRPVTPSNVDTIIPARGGIDVLPIPPGGQPS